MADAGFEEKRRAFFALKNPIANADQREVEALALRLLAHPTVGPAKAEAAKRWYACAKQINGRPEPMSMALNAFEDYAFNYALKVANSDSNYPKILKVQGAAHEWFGMKVPGAKLGGDNGDNAYRLIPVDTLARYEIHGKRHTAPPDDVTFTLTANYGNTITLGSLDNNTLAVNPDGTFVITMDDAPAEGRPNHVQFPRGEVRYLFMRDSLGDWETQRFNAIVPRRLTPPTAPPLSEDALAARLAAALIEDVVLSIMFVQYSMRIPVNTFWKPMGTGANGGLVSQVSAAGYYILADDEALVITMTRGPAAYLSLYAHDAWYRTVEFDRRTSGLNHAQTKTNPDGTYTFVVAPRDPGVYNWIDTGGLHEGLLITRWQGLPDKVSPDDYPKVLQIEAVKQSDLARVLPKGTPRLGPDERSALLAKRRKDYWVRWATD